MQQATFTLPSLRQSEIISGRTSPHLTEADQPRIDDLAKVLKGAFKNLPLKTTPTQVLAVLTASKRRIKKPANWQKRALVLSPGIHESGLFVKTPYDVDHNFDLFFEAGLTSKSLMVPKERDKDLCMCAYGAIARPSDRRTRHLPRYRARASGNIQDRQHANHLHRPVDQAKRRPVGWKHDAQSGRTGGSGEGAMTSKQLYEYAPLEITKAGGKP